MRGPVSTLLTREAGAGRSDPFRHRRIQVRQHPIRAGATANPETGAHQLITLRHDNKAGDDRPPMTLDRRCAGSATACIVAALLSAGIEAHVDEENPGDETVINVAIDEQCYRLALEKRTGQRRSNVMFVRWNKNQPRELDTFLPLPADHPAHGERCLWCRERLGNGQLVQLLVLGATTQQDRIAHFLGLEYGAMAAYGHGACISGEAPAPPSGG